MDLGPVLRDAGVLILALIVAGCTVVPATSGPSTETAPASAPGATLEANPTEGPATELAEPDGSARREFDTDFSMHSVPYDEISGVLPKDTIPAIDEPKLVTTAEADAWLAGREPVLAVRIDGEARAYPIQILTWHEIVNDEVGGISIAATYCPLCNTGIVFDRRVEDMASSGDGQVLEFGTTGRLRYSNLIMYDRQTESWWQQATGEAIAGTYTGGQLNFVPSFMISWADFRDRYADGRVLSRETGHRRDYGRNPYPGYDDPGNSPFAYRGPETPDDLPQMARVVGVELSGEAVAYPYDELERARVVNDSVGGAAVGVFWKAGTASALDASSVAEGADVGAATVFSRDLGDRTLTFAFEDGSIVDEETGSEWDIAGEAVRGPLQGQRLEAVVSINHFWFSWAAFHRDTRVYAPDAGSTAPEGAEGRTGSSAHVPARTALPACPRETASG